MPKMIAPTTHLQKNENTITHINTKRAKTYVDSRSLERKPKQPSQQTQDKPSHANRTSRPTKSGQCIPLRPNRSPNMHGESKKKKNDDNMALDNITRSARPRQIHVSSPQASVEENHSHRNSAHGWHRPFQETATFFSQCLTPCEISGRSCSFTPTMPANLDIRCSVWPFHIALPAAVAHAREVHSLDGTRLSDVVRVVPLPVSGYPQPSRHLHP